MSSLQRHAAKADVIQIIIADDDPLVRAAIGTLLANGAAYQLIAEANDGDEAISLVRKLRPHVLLLDLNMPRKHGLETLRGLSDELPEMRTIVLTLAIDKRQIVEALQLGAKGVVLKADARTLLLPSIQAVLRGQYWVKDREIEDVKDIIQEIGRFDGARSGQAKLGLLSPKEAQIVAYIVEGRTNKDIASTLQTSEQVVKNHLGKIFDKLGVFNRLELALYAIDNGMVDRR
jgi:two-component system, NarL family, nitrate/nitrite response regulator NarL